MVPAADNSANASPHREEKLFLSLVIALALVTGVGSWFAAAALSKRDKPHGIQPDKERTLGEFS